VDIAERVTSRSKANRTFYQSNVSPVRRIQQRSATPIWSLVIVLSFSSLTLSLLVPDVAFGRRFDNNFAFREPRNSLEKVAILLDALCIWSPKDIIERSSRCQSVIETSTTSSAPSKADARADNGGSVGSLELEGTSSKSGEHDREDVGADL
jgi:hypothetical protein